MGAIAEAMMAYAQPLIDETDGSLDQMNRALAVSQLCWNLALLPEEERDGALEEMRPDLKMEDEEFEAFLRTVVVPMVLRHEEMFPRMHRIGSMKPARGARASPTRPPTPACAEKYPGTGRNAPCPCNSGRKYKLCCGR
jgi:uncharacterized protein YecA (UPF0149 family)